MPEAIQVRVTELSYDPKGLFWTGFLLVTFQWVASEVRKNAQHGLGDRRPEGPRESPKQLVKIQIPGPLPVFLWLGLGMRTFHEFLK